MRQRGNEAANQREYTRVFLSCYVCLWCVCVCVCMCVCVCVCVCVCEFREGLERDRDSESETEHRASESTYSSTHSGRSLASPVFQMQESHTQLS
jgi:hypothetical protein